VLNQKIASVLGVVKWPLAILCAAYFPATAIALGEELLGIVRGMHFLVPFIAGATLYLAIWLLFMRRIKVDFFSTLEHEITHCIFAWLTFNRVVGLKATLRSGGTTHYQGTPNWLIQTSPYFFPTVTIVLLIVMHFVGPQHLLLMYGLLGASIVYHVISTWAEAHHRQTDLRQAGLVFSLMFLPTANLIFYALIIAFLRFGSGGFAQLFAALAHSPANPLRLVAQIWS
jgi:Peptidase M50B-like